MIDTAVLKASNPLPTIIERMTSQQIIKHKTVCPFHNDRNPSLHVYDDGGFKCFGCGVAGDVLDFVGLYLFGPQYNRDSHFLDVVDHLGALGIKPLPQPQKFPKPAPKNKSKLSVSPDRIMQWHNTMPASRREWWHGRGLWDSTIDSYKLGWDGHRYTIPVSYRGIYYAVKRRQSNVPDSFPDDKYVSAKGSRVGIFNADMLNGCERLIICEGEIDCMLLYQAGFVAVSSTGGAGTWRSQWNEHVAHIPHIYTIFDNDNAGQRGAYKLQFTLRRARNIQLPSFAKDVGEWLSMDDCNPIGWLRKQTGK